MINARPDPSNFSEVDPRSKRPGGAAIGAVDPQTTAFAQLLRIEAEARQVTSERDLLHLIANETLLLVGARQVFVMRRAGHQRLRLGAVSSVPAIDRAAPLTMWIEDIVASLRRDRGANQTLAATLPDHADPADPLTSSYPMRYLLWVPLWSRNKAFASGMLLARETPWRENDLLIAERLAGAFGHAWALLASPLRLRDRIMLTDKVRRSLIGASIVAICALAALPVPLTALAPLEIAARDPVVVAMPVDGTILDVPVSPNASVAKGDQLIQLVDTQLRNKLEISERELIVAEAKLQKVTQLSISDVKSRHDLGIARAESALRTAERNFARDMFDKSIIVAPRAGVAVFGDRKDFIGRPLVTGDRLMEIADPRSVELKIDMPVSDALVLEPGARVKAFLDGDPLHPREAFVVRFDYQARLNETRTAIVRVTAELADQNKEIPRLGIRGTAQVYGASRPLIFVLLRRPLSALRQGLGL